MTSALYRVPHSAAENEMSVEQAVTCHHDLLRKLSDLDLFACLIWVVAKDEKVEGRLAIAHVVLNRFKARTNYGGTIRDAILELDHFTCIKEDDPDSALILIPPSDDREFGLCRAIAELATRGHLRNDPTGGATHFYKVNSKPPWAAAEFPNLRQIGNIVFYRESLNRSRQDHSLTVHKRSIGMEL